VRTVLVSRARLLLPRTTAALAGPWALTIPPGAAAPRSPTETASMVASGPKGIPETVHPWTVLISVVVVD
jgi:hypothetical protein